MNEQLQCQLADACKFYGILEQYKSAIDNMKDKRTSILSFCDEYKKQNSFSAKKGNFLIIFGNILLGILLTVLGFLCIILIYPCLMIIFGAPNDEAKAILFALSQIPMYIGLFYLYFPVGIPIGLVFYKRKYCNKKDQELLAAAEVYCQENYYPEIKECDENIQNLINELNNFFDTNKHILLFLPQEYRNATAVIYMEQAVRNCRADSLKEAINLYEDQLHKWKIEQQNQELLDQQALQNYLLEEQRDAMDRMRREQRSTSTALAGIEALQFYNTFCR